MDMVRALYSENQNTTLPLWTADINIAEFFARTRPSYHLVTCFLDHVDCARHWRLEGKKIGIVLSTNFFLLQQ